MGNSPDKTTIKIKEKIVIEPVKTKKKQKESWLKSCFGPKKTQKPKESPINTTQKPQQFLRDTRKSTILVRSKPFIQIDQKLFQNRQKKLLDVHLIRQQPYEILKDSDYFDSYKDDKTELENMRKTYESCDIVNYQTPPVQKLQTAIVKTYLFDRNLTKIES